MGQDVASLTCRFSYPQGNYTIYPELGNNKSELSRLDAFIQTAIYNSEYQIKRIRLTGYSSIEGNYHSNEQLSRDRVEGLYHYLREHYPMLYRYPYDIAWVAEDWKGLSALISESDLEEKNEVLSIIRHTHAFDTREKLIRKLNGGHLYQQISETILPQLRRVEIEVEYGRIEGREWRVESYDAGQLHVDPLIYNVLDKDTTDFRKKRDLANAVNRRNRWFTSCETSLPTSFAVKTNLLYWAGITADAERTTPVPNLSVEYFLSPRWSIEAGAKCSNWHYDNDQQFQGISGYRLEGRYYILFSTIHNQYITPYLGVYGRFGDYNIQPSRAASPPSEGAGGGDGYTGKYHDFGLSAGLHIRLYRGLGLELGARAGYVSSTPTVYNLHNDHNCYQYETSYSKFRVTDLNINLVYRFRK